MDAKLQPGCVERILKRGWRGDFSPAALAVALGLPIALLSGISLTWLAMRERPVRPDVVAEIPVLLALVVGWGSIVFARRECWRRQTMRRQRDALAMRASRAEAALSRIHEQSTPGESAVRVALDCAGVAMWSWDAGRRQLEFGENCPALLGHPPSAQPDVAELRAALEPEGRLRLVAACDAAIAGDGRCSCDFAIIHPDGSRHWLRARGLRRGAKSLAGGLRDVTAEIEAAEAARRGILETRSDPAGLAVPAGRVGSGTLEAALVTAPQLVLVAADQSGAITHFNRGAEQLLGFRAADMIGRKLTSLHDPDQLATRAGERVRPDAPTGEAIDLLAVLSGGPEGDEREWIWLGRDGERLSVALAALARHDAAGNPAGVLVIGRDTAARTVMEERLRLQGAALEAAENAVVITNSAGVMCWVNPAFTRLTGYAAAEAVGKNIRLLNSGTHPRAFFASLWDLIRAGHVWRGELLNRRKDGSTYFEEMTITPVPDESGRIAHFIAVKSDVTQRRRQEAMLHEAMRSVESSARAKSEFLAVMSHEIRTPMNGVIGLSNLLRGTQLDATQQRYIETIHMCGESLLSVINQILDFSKLEAGKLELEHRDFNLRELVDDTLEMVADRAYRKGLELIGRIVPGVPCRLHGDLGRLRQVLINLVNNAVKFTSAGEVAVEISCVEETSRGARLRFCVIDTGPGLSPDAVERLFQPFVQADSSTTRRYGGTGLGLAISQQLVALMGGTITVTSAPGAGSTFEFAVEIPQQPPTGDDPDAGRRERFGGLRVLVVDDRKRWRDMVTETLAPWGLSCGTAEHAREALAGLHAAAEAGRPYALVLAGSDLPDAGGMELADAINGDLLLRDIRVVLLTPLGRVVDEGLLREAGVAVCVTKPVREAQLFDAVARALGVDHAADEEAAQDPEPVTRALPEASQVRILFAEDNNVNQLVGIDQLGTLGFAADVVADGREAVAALSQTPYDVVLMDCMMPEMDGYEATRRIRELERRHGPGFESRRPVRIIAMTANALPGDREQCLAAGMDDYIAKPVCDQDLRRALERWLPPAAVTRRHAAGDTSAADGPGVLPVVDRARLGQITAGNRQKTRRLIQTYLAGADVMRRSLHEAIVRSAIDEVRTLAHRWAGSSGTCGLPQMAEAAHRLETLARSGSLGGATGLLRACLAAHDRTLPVLNQLLESPINPNPTTAHEKSSCR